MKLEHAPKTVELENGEKLHFWYANNKGNSGCNVTIIKSTSPRASMSRNQKNAIRIIKAGHFRGHVNFSKSVQNYLEVN